MRVVVLGCGFHGRGVAYQIANSGEVGELVVADRNPALASRVAEKTGAEWVELDVRDRAKMLLLLDGARAVFNAVGPYHLYALDVISVALQTGTHYIDMNDDHEVAEAIFCDPAWNYRAREAGIAILSGCGIMPGLSGLLARYGYDQLHKADSVSVWFAWNYSLAYPAAIHHFFRINSGLGPQYIDGQYSKPGPFSGRERIGFLSPVGTREVYYTGVPDPISIVHSLPGLAQATARGAMYQPAANQLMEAMVRWGFTSYEKVPGADQSPFEFLMSYLTSQQGSTYFDITPERVPMAVRVEIGGARDGSPHRLTFEAHDYSRRATTVVAALSTIMVATGQLSECGVGAPEGWIPAQPLLRQLTKEPDIRIFAVDDGGRPRPLQP